MKEYAPWAVAAIGLFAVVLTGDRTPSTWLSYIEVAAAVVLAVIAVWAFIYARRQFGTSQEQAKAAKDQAIAAQETVKQAKTAMIWEMDRGYESEFLATARRHLADLEKELEEEITKQKPEYLAKEKQDAKYLEMFREESAKRLHQMWEGRDEKYSAVLSLLGFFETVGVLVKREFIDAEIIHDLYGLAIELCENMTRLHLEGRQDQRGKVYFENFIWLCDAIKKID